jgi:hypothetical protein
MGIIATVFAGFALCVLFTGAPAVASSQPAPEQGFSALQGVDSQQLTSGEMSEIRGELSPLGVRLLAAFTARVNFWVSRGFITHAQADRLIAATTAFLNRIFPSPPPPPPPPPPRVD